jgi:hypothetical protein
VGINVSNYIVVDKKAEVKLVKAGWRVLERHTDAKGVEFALMVAGNSDDVDIKSSTYAGKVFPFKEARMYFDKKGE